MIKLVLCVRRKVGVDEVAFRDYWNNGFDRFVRKAGSELQSKKITKSLTLHIEANDTLQLRQHSVKAFDGMVEFWLDEPQKAFAVTSTDRWKEQITELFNDQQFSLDMQQSVLFFVEETTTVSES